MHANKQLVIVRTGPLTKVLSNLYKNVYIFLNSIHKTQLIIIIFTIIAFVTVILVLFIN